MGIRGEIFSSSVNLPNRTYFFNVKENRMGDLYLNIVESKNRDNGGFDRQSVILFADDLQEFLKGFDESLRVLEKAMREKRHSGEPGSQRFSQKDEPRKDFKRDQNNSYKDEGFDQREKKFRPEGRSRPERSARPEGSRRPERNSRPEGRDRPERSGRPERRDRPEGSRRPERRDRPEGRGRSERSSRPERSGRPEGRGRPERSARPEGRSRPEGNKWRDEGNKRPERNRRVIVRKQKNSSVE